MWIKPYSCNQPKYSWLGLDNSWEDSQSKDPFFLFLSCWPHAATWSFFSSFILPVFIIPLVTRVMLRFVAIKLEARFFMKQLVVMVSFPLSALRLELVRELFIGWFIRWGSLRRRCHRLKLQTIPSPSRPHRRKYRPRARKSQWLCCFMLTTRPRRPWEIFS